MTTGNQRVLNPLSLIATALIRNEEATTTQKVVSNNPRYDFTFIKIKISKLMYH